jgi:hypothetical protein
LEDHREVFEGLFDNSADVPGIDVGATYHDDRTSRHHCHLPPGLNGVTELANTGGIADGTA